VNRIPRFLVPLVFALAFALPPLLVGGAGIGRAMLASLEKAPNLSTTLPAQPTYDPSKPVAVVVAGNGITESSDLLGPYETLSTSGRFNVYVAAPERRPSPLFPGKLNLLPHYAFAEYDQAFGGRPDLVVVPYIPDAEPAVLDWIRAKAAAGSTILSICAGAQVVADAGVLAGQMATTHHDTLPIVEKSHPEVQWVHNRRYVESGQFISSAGITAGVDASLYTLERFFGREVADQTAEAMGYPHTRFLDDPTWLVPSNNVVQTLPNAYRVHPTQIGMVLYDGVREVEVSSILDTYPRSYAAEVHPLASQPGRVQTRHGLDLVAPEDLSTAPSLDRVLLPGSPDARVAGLVDRWAAARGLHAERIHPDGVYAYDATLRDMARDESNSVVREAATGLEYPTRDLQLAGPEWRLDLIARPLALGLLGLGALLLLRNRRRLAVAA
jgi:AraC family transcriptional regulator, transcriptional activator FtrA